LASKRLPKSSLFCSGSGSNGKRSSETDFGRRDCELRNMDARGGDDLVPPQGSLELGEPHELQASCAEEDRRKARRARSAIVGHRCDLYVVVQNRTQRREACPSGCSRAGHPQGNGGMIGRWPIAKTTLFDFEARFGRRAERACLRLVSAGYVRRSIATRYSRRACACSRRRGAEERRVITGHIFGIPVEESLPVLVPLAGVYASYLTTLRRRSRRHDRGGRP
jgi:hypothetical protein